MTVNARSLAVMEHRSHVRSNLPHFRIAPVEGVDEGEVEYEITQEQWQRGPVPGSHD